jgi:MFS family permease
MIETDAATPHIKDSDEAYKWRAFAAIGISFFASVLSTTMVFVALSDIAADFDVTLRAVGWVVITESLIISATMLPFGGLADQVGRKRVHLVGLVIFMVGAAATALAPTFVLLICARIVMALGNSMAQSVGTGMLAAAFPVSERGTAMGAQTLSVAIGGVAGPLIAGLVLRYLPWEALFIGLLVPLAISFVAGLVLLDEARVGGGAADRVSFDWTGSLLSASTIVIIVITVNNPFDVAWTSWSVLAGAGAAVMLLVSFVRWELRVENPMLQVRLFRNRVLAYAVRWCSPSPPQLHCCCRSISLACAACRQPGPH